MILRGTQSSPAPAADGKGEPHIEGFRDSKRRSALDPRKKELAKASTLRQAILAEEAGRWPDNEWRRLVAAYQEKVGMTRKIAELRARQPIQYLHLLKAGYFEPIPVAWANQPSNPLKFSVEAAAGWRKCSSLARVRGSRRAAVLGSQPPRRQRGHEDEAGLYLEK